MAEQVGWNSQQQRQELGAAGELDTGALTDWYVLDLVTGQLKGTQEQVSALAQAQQLHMFSTGPPPGNVACILVGMVTFLQQQT